MGFVFKKRVKKRRASFCKQVIGTLTLIHKNFVDEQHFLVSAFPKTLTCLKFAFKRNETQENRFYADSLLTVTATNTKLCFDVKRSGVTKNAFLKSAELIVVNTFIPFHRNSVHVLICYGSPLFMALANKFCYSAGIVIKVIMPAKYYDSSFRSLTFSELCFVAYLEFSAAPIYRSTMLTL